MKKLARVGCLLLMITLLITGCSTPEKVDDTPTEAPTAKPTPTFFLPTPEPTITPRPMDNVETPAPEATPILIDPIDKPTPVPIAIGDYTVVTEAALGITFEIPSYFARIGDDSSLNLPTPVAYQEPEGGVRNETGIPASVTFWVVKTTSTQDIEKAKVQLDDAIEILRKDIPSLTVSRKDSQKLIGETGTYVTIDFEVFASDGVTVVKMRGRFLAIPKGNNIYMIRTSHPLTYNTEYDDKVYKKIRATITTL